MNINQILRISTLRQILFFCALILLGMLLMSFPVGSTTSDSEKPVVISATEIVNDDVYLAGDTVTVDGTVKGDAVLAGRQITVNGTVEGDLMAAGQTVVVNGTVKDDIRIAGQALQLGSKARVGDDVMAAGVSLENQSGSTVGGNLHLTSAQALLAGKVVGNVVIETNSLDLRGTVGKNMTVTAIADPDLKPFTVPFMPKPSIAIPQIQPGLTLGDAARIGNKLTYQSLNAANISQGAQVTGGVVREQLPEETVRAHSRYGEPRNAAWVVLHQLQRLAALVLVGWLLMRFVPTWTQSLAATVQAKPLPSLAWGIVSCLAVVGMMVAVAIATFILTGLSTLMVPNLIGPFLGLGTLANFALVVSFLIFVSYVPQIVVSFLGGRWLLHKIRPEVSSGLFMSSIVGLVAFVILTAIPVIGEMLNLIVVFLGLGALWMLWRGKSDRFPNPQLILTHE